MNNSFLFIIPLTPTSHLTKVRKELLDDCLKSLKNQKYKNWKALLIGENKPLTVTDSRFIHLATEGLKGLKIKKALEYLTENEISFDYIIRLDDDDLISNSVLARYENSNADIIVDLEHWYLEYETKKVSKDFKPWFANTCIHKYENAVAIYSGLKNLELNESISLIENDHSTIHEFYRGKKISFTNLNAPIYLRILNRHSITSKSEKSYIEYLKKYGNWDQNVPEGFPALTNPKIEKNKIDLKNSLYLIISKFKFKHYLRSKN